MYILYIVYNMHFVIVYNIYIVQCSICLLKVHDAKSTTLANIAVGRE